MLLRYNNSEKHKNSTAIAFWAKNYDTILNYSKNLNRAAQNLPLGEMRPASWTKLV